MPGILETDWDHGSGVLGEGWLMLMAFFMGGSLGQNKSFPFSTSLIVWFTPEVRVSVETTFILHLLHSRLDFLLSILLTSRALCQSPEALQELGGSSQTPPFLSSLTLPLHPEGFGVF